MMGHCLFYPWEYLGIYLCKVAPCNFSPLSETSAWVLCTAGNNLVCLATVIFYDQNL